MVRVRNIRAKVLNPSVMSTTSYTSDLQHLMGCVIPQLVRLTTAETRVYVGIPLTSVGVWNQEHYHGPNNSYTY